MPEPLGPMTQTTSPAPDVEIDAAEDMEVAEVLLHLLDRHHRLGTRHPAHSVCRHSRDSPFQHHHEAMPTRMRRVAHAPAREIAKQQTK